MGKETSYQKFLWGLGLIPCLYFFPFLWGLLILLHGTWMSVSTGGQWELWILGARWAGTGIIIAGLTALIAWPFSLALVTAQAYRRHHQFGQKISQAVRFFSQLPLLFFLILVTNDGLQPLSRIMQGMWSYTFTSNNLFTQALAFAVTLIAYPFTVIPGLGEGLSVNEFFNRVHYGIIQFGDVSLLVLLGVSTLWMAMLPRMVQAMNRRLHMGTTQASIDVVKALGGNNWQSLYLSVMQLMKQHRGVILLQSLRFGFFEGLMLLTLSVQVQFVSSAKPLSMIPSLTSEYVRKLLDTPMGVAGLLPLLTLLVSLCLIFLALEWRWDRPGECDDGV